MTKLQKVIKIARSKGLQHEIKLSTRKNNKFMVLVKDKWVHFGHKDYKDFIDHKDPDRRKNYLSRARGIRDGNGKLTHKNKTSANFWSINLLW